MKAKPFLRSKTVWFNLLVMGVLAAHLAGRIDLTKTFSDLQDSDIVPLMVVTGLNLLLRVITRKPILRRGGKLFLRSRTLWLNGLILGGIAAQILGYGDFTHYASEAAKHINELFSSGQTGGVDTMALLMITLNNFFLRFQTEERLSLRPV